MKRIISIGLLLAPLWCSAQKFQAGDNVVISKPVFEDLYLAGGNITINAPVHGDLVIAGGTVNINDSVSNDIIIAGGEITINGAAGDDIRFAGGKLNINKNVAGDVVITGGKLLLAKNSSVGGSLIAGGGEITVDGKINGYLKAGAGSLLMNGSVAKTLDARGQEVTINGTVGGNAVLSAHEINIGQDAAFANKVRYWSDEPVNFGSSVRSGQAMSDESLQIEQGSWKYLGFATFLGLLWYVGAAFIFIVLIQYLLGKRIRHAAASITQHNAPRFIGYGFLFFILAPIAIFFAILTLIGIPLAVLMMVLFIALVLLASIITSVVLANYVNMHYYHNQERWRQIWTALGIFILIKIVTLIPVAGWLLMIAAVCLAFGVLLIEFFRPERRGPKLDVPQY